MNRRDLLVMAAASPTISLSTVALAAVPQEDPLLALVSEWNDLEAELNAEPEDMPDSDPRAQRQQDIEAALVDGVTPTTLAGAFAALSFARREADGATPPATGVRAAWRRSTTRTPPQA